MAVLTAATILTVSCSKDDDKLQSFRVSPERSSATWKGYLRTGYFNEGTIDIESTSNKVKDGIVAEGNFKMPLSSLKNLNLPDDQKPLLIGHLQSPDFFNMVLHPSLNFSIRKVSAYNGDDSIAVPGSNYYVEGDLTMLGIVQPVAFPAKITVKEESLEVDADILIDRTRWGMNYATADTLSDEHYIEPEVTIKLHVAGTKTK